MLKELQRHQIMQDNTIYVMSAGIYNPLSKQSKLG